MFKAERIGRFSDLRKLLYYAKKYGFSCVDLTVYYRHRFLARGIVDLHALESWCR